MIVKHDKSYCNYTDLMEHKLAVQDLYSVRLQFLIPESQKEKDLEDAKQLSRKTWDALCLSRSVERNRLMKSVMEAINQKFSVYQYNKSVRYDSPWDFFFWCNFMENADGEREPDFSYFTLNFNQQEPRWRRKHILSQLLEFLQSRFPDSDYLQLTVQYSTELLKPELKKAAEQAVASLEDCPVTYKGMDGRIQKTENGVFFLKKYAKTRGYQLSDAEIVRIFWQSKAA